MTKFSPTYGSGELYIYDQQLLDDAIGRVNQDHYNVYIRDYFWIQGEADSSLPVSTYKDCFTEWNTAITSDSTFYESMNNWTSGNYFKNCYISLIPSQYANSYQAQIDLAETIDNVHISTKIANTFTIENGMLSSGDGVHYTQKGDNEIGKYLSSSAIASAPDKHPTTDSIEWKNTDDVALYGLIIVIVLVIPIVFGIRYITRDRD